MRRSICFCFFALIAAADTGTPTRPTASDYDAHQTIRDATIAASLLSATETAKIFPGAVSKNFVVIEVAVYPENGRTFDLLALDFALKVSADDRAYAVTPEEVAWHGKRHPDPASAGGLSNGVHVASEVGVGVGTRTNPVTGKTDHGVYTYGGVGVDNRPQSGAPPATSSTDNTYVLEGKLRGLELQEGQSARPVSGYLYFPAPKKQKNSPLTLEYSRSGERAVLTLPMK